MKVWRLVVQNELFLYAPDDATEGQVIDAVESASIADGDIDSVNETKQRDAGTPDGWLRWEDGSLELCDEDEFLDAEHIDPETGDPIETTGGAR